MQQNIAVHQAQVGNSKVQAKNVSTREKVMATTMSVDEYFDELIDLVREDYANV